MRYISLFSGIEAATVAWRPLGWEPVAFSEIDPFPKAVLAHHYPGVPDLGDMTEVDWKEYHGKADVVVGGSPCQAFSVAGLRKGLDDPRGQLMLQYFRACHDIDPQWIVWENVPGVLSAHNGCAFGTLLACVAELWPDGGAAWRVLDSQFYGVAQRRRRVFVVINTRDWKRAAPVLFERESLRWDYPTSKAKRKALAGGVATSTGTPSAVAIAGNIIGRKPGNGGNGRGYETEGAMYTLTATDVHGVWCAGDSGTNMSVYQGMSPTLTAHDAKAACFVNQAGVRRLMPVECERLQGFPDGYTDVPWRGKAHSPDSKRYKALGNSMAVPVMRWIGEGIELVDGLMVD